MNVCMLYIDTLMHTWAKWCFDGKWVKYLKLYIQMPAENLIQYLVEFHADCFTLLLINFDAIFKRISHYS